MDDTTPEIADRVRDMIRMKTPFERFMMGASMYETSKFLVTQAILRENPHASEVTLKQELFLRFYRNEFNQEEREKILRHFEQLQSP